ncbi:MAG: hypothetical protein P8R54_12285 [Myxococcota bacterium]|nr:hypothetical protein [Myxococcota bacterium]
MFLFYSLPAAALSVAIEVDADKLCYSHCSFSDEEYGALPWSVCFGCEMEGSHCSGWGAASEKGPGAQAEQEASWIR